MKDGGFSHVKMADKKKSKKEILKEKISPIIEFILVEHRNLLEMAIKKTKPVKEVKNTIKNKAKAKIDEKLKPNMFTKKILDLLVITTVEGMVDKIIKKGLDSLNAFTSKSSENTD